MPYESEHTAQAGPIAGPESEFQQLDPRVVVVWRLTHIIAFAFLLIPSLVGALVVGEVEPSISIWFYAGWFLFLVLLALIVVMRPRRLYRSWGYRIDEKVLETRRGLIFRLTQLLPLSRLQHVDLHRGPIERLFGLSTLVLHTAGTHEARITIPGLDAAEAVRLRDHLVEVGGDDAV